MTIQGIIRDAEIREIAEVMRGDCASVAAGLRDCFGGEYVLLFATPENCANELPAHVVVEIDGELYDGSGVVTREKLFEMHLCLTGACEKQTDISKYFQYESPPSVMIDSDVREQVVSRVKSVQED